MSDRKTEYSPLNAENRTVTHGFVFAYIYMHEEINILLSDLSIYFFFLF